MALGSLSLPFLPLSPLFHSFSMPLGSSKDYEKKNVWRMNVVDNDQKKKEK